MAKRKNTAKTKRYLIIATGAAAAVAILAVLFIFREKPLEVTTVPAIRKEIVHIVTATGKSSRKPMLLYPQMYRVKSLNFPSGRERVLKKGRSCSKSSPMSISTRLNRAKPS